MQCSGIVNYNEKKIYYSIYIILSTRYHLSCVYERLLYSQLLRFILRPTATNRQQRLAGLIVNEPYERKHTRMIWNIKQFSEI